MSRERYAESKMNCGIHKDHISSLTFVVLVNPCLSPSRSFETDAKASENSKNGVKDLLPYSRGDKLFVIRMIDCPKGHWQCRNTFGDVGFVPCDDVAIDSDTMKKSLSAVVGSGGEEWEVPRSPFDSRSVLFFALSTVRI
jgi:hypothetical protein